MVVDHDYSGAEAVSILLTETRAMLARQGEENGEGRHPDPTIRTFNRALLRFLEERPDITNKIGMVATERSINKGHLVDLLARITQFQMRREEVTGYAKFTEEEFLSWFRTLTDQKTGEFLQVMRERNVATHLVARYRGLAVLTGRLCSQHDRDLDILDVGCSGNFGLPATLEPELLLSSPVVNGKGLIDFTPDLAIQNGLRSYIPRYRRAIGIDIQPPDEEWQLACSYFSQYDATKQRLSHAREKFSDSGIPTVVADIAAKTAEERWQLFEALDVDPQIGAFDVVHSSMVMYQLSPAQRCAAEANIASSLRDGGLSIQVAWEDERDWFKEWNCITTVAQKRRGELNPPAIWLRWKNGRCDEVKAGEGFEEIHGMVELPGDAELMLPVALLQTHAS